jgi:transposase-like protein
LPRLAAGVPVSGWTGGGGAVEPTLGPPEGIAMRRHYTDEQRAEALAALAANGGNIKLTAAQLGIPRMTLADWANGACCEAVTELRHQKKQDLADALEALAYKLVEAAAGKIADAPLQACATAAGIAVDKMLLLRNQPTVIAQTKMTDEEIDAEIRRLGKELGYFDPKPN